MLVEFAHLPGFETLLGRVYSVVFFGPPHRGLEIESLEQLTRGRQRHGLIADLGRDSTLLRDLNDKFPRVSDHLKIITCFELHATPTAQARPDSPEAWERTGPLKMMADWNSACLYTPNETRIAIDQNHSMIAKLSGADPAYQQLKNHLEEHVRDSRKHMRARISRASASQDLQSIFDIGKSIIDIAECMEIKNDKGLIVALKRAIAFLVAFRQFLDEDISMAILIHGAPSNRLIGAISDSIQELERQYGIFKAVVQYYKRFVDDGKLRRFDETANAELGARLKQSTRYASLFQLSRLTKLKEFSVTCVEKLARVTWLALLGAQGIDSLEQIEGMDSARAAGLSQAAVRQIALRAAEMKGQKSVPLSGRLDEVKLKSDPRIQNFHPAGSTSPFAVIVENRRYQKEMSLGLRPENKAEKKAKEQIALLATVLQLLSSKLEQNPLPDFDDVPKTCMLQCLGYLEDDEKGILSLVFKVPTWKSGTDFDDIDSLHDVLNSQTGQPTLQQRFRLARAICTSILHLHCWGWVHKDIRPENIILVRKPADMESEEDTNYREQDDFTAYLSGFEIAREANGDSVMATTTELKKNLYRHPQRQHTPSRRFTKFDDLYAVGVVLLEIGIQKTLDAVFMGRVLTGLAKTGFAPKPDSIARSIQKLAAEQLPQKMGARYTEAVRKCLTGDFGVDSDSEAQSELSLAFQDMVLDSIEYGCHL